jgi:hypothetical protein
MLACAISEGDGRTSGRGTVEEVDAMGAWLSRPFPLMSAPFILAIPIAIDEN